MYTNAEQLILILYQDGRRKKNLSDILKTVLIVGVQMAEASAKILLN